MSTAALKNLLISRITAIEDKTFLQAIRAFTESNSDQKIYRTTPEQKKNIKEGQDQIASGAGGLGYHVAWLRRSGLTLLILHNNEFPGFQYSALLVKNGNVNAWRTT